MTIGRLGTPNEAKVILHYGFMTDQVCETRQRSHYWDPIELYYAHRLMNIPQGKDSLFPSHSLFYSLQCCIYLLIIISSPNNLQTNRRSRVLLWSRVHGLHERIRFVAWLVPALLELSRVCRPVDGRIHHRHREGGSRVVEQVPLRGVAPILGGAVRGCGSRSGGCKDEVDLVFAVDGGGAPVCSVCFAVFVAGGAELDGRN